MAAVKDVAKQVIDALPADATMDDVMHALYVRAKCERADREIEDGEGITHEEAKRRLRKWLR
jgi:hypothetical protein